MGKRKRVRNMKLRKVVGGEGTEDTNTAALVDVKETVIVTHDKSEDISTSEGKKCEEVELGASLNINNSLQNEREDALNESEMNNFPRKRGVRSKKLKKVNEDEKAAEFKTASQYVIDATEAVRNDGNKDISSGECVEKSHTVETDNGDVTKVISSGEFVENSHTVEADDVNVTEVISSGEFVEKSHTVDADDDNVTEAVLKDENKEMPFSENIIAGFIFMCSDKTKSDCYRFRVFGLPAGKLEIVKKIKKDTKLYLFDFNLKILYGIYSAVSEGEKGLETDAFGGAFPAQVKFEIFKECIPLPERVFKQAIKENYRGSKFNPELNREQVRKLSALFRQLPPQRGLSPPLGTIQHLEPRIVPQTRLPPPDGTRRHFAQLHMLHPYVAGAPFGRAGSPLLGTNQHLEPRIAPQTGLLPLDGARRHFAQSHLPHPYVAEAPLGRAGIQYMPEDRRPVHPYVAAANLALSQQFEPRHVPFLTQGTLHPDPYHRYGPEVCQMGIRDYAVAVAERLLYQAYAGGRGSEMIVPGNVQPQLGFQVPPYDNSSRQHWSTGLAAQTSINMNSTETRGPDQSLNYYTGVAPRYQSR